MLFKILIALCTISISMTAKAEFWDQPDYFANKEVYDEVSSIIDTLYSDIKPGLKASILATKNKDLVSAFRVLKKANEKTLIEQFKKDALLSDDEINSLMNKRLTIEALKVTLENDFLSGTDKYYTAGHMIEISFNNKAFESFVKKLGYDHSDLFVLCRQDIYNTSDRNIEEKVDDEPGYAGIAYCGSAVNAYKMNKDKSRAKILDRLSVRIGSLGPSAQAKEVQNAFHALIGDKQVNWDYQVKDKFLFQIDFERNIKVAEGNIGSGSQPDYNIIVSAGGNAGSLTNFAKAGVLLNYRLIGSLIDMYTANRFPSSSVEQLARLNPVARAKAVICKNDWNANLYLGAGSKVVINNNRIDNTSFNVSSNRFVFDLKAGVVVNYIDVYFDLSWTKRTSEWEDSLGNKGASHSWGSFSFIYPFKNYSDLKDGVLYPVKMITNKEFRRKELEKRRIKKQIKKEGITLVLDKDDPSKSVHIKCD